MEAYSPLMYYPRFSDVEYKARSNAVFQGRPILTRALLVLGSAREQGQYPVQPLFQDGELLL